MSKNVVIVEPSGAKDNVFSRYMKLPLLGPVYLGSVLRDAGFGVRILNESILGRPVEPSDLDADFLLVGGLTCSIVRGYEVARMYRDRNPRGQVIMGGIHASFMPHEALEVADHVVVGEAEGVITDLLRHGSNERIVPGSPVTDLDTLPAPDLSLVAGFERIDVAPAMTSRGCPFDCSFCAVTKMFGRRHRTASIPTVMRDLAQTRQSFVFFYDDNLTADLRRAHELCDALMHRPRHIKEWSAQVRVDVAKDEDLVAKMRAAGCCKVYIGFESLDADALASYRKHQTADDILKAVSVLHRNQIAVHGMFVLGSDEEGKSAAKDVLSFCLRHHVDSAQFMILTPFPGTPLFDSLREQSRLLHTDWPYYDAMHVVFRPKTRTPLQLQHEMLEAFQQFYSYRGALRDAWRAASDALGHRRRPTRVLRQPLAGQSAVLKIAGRAILHRFQRLNQSYMGFLAAQA